MEETMVAMVIRELKFISKDFCENFTQLDLVPEKA